MSRIAQLAAMVTAAVLMASTDDFGNSSDVPWGDRRHEPPPTDPETLAAVDAIRADRARRKAENFAKRQAK